ncbi:FHA domain-containing protein [Candidatus Woesearchaeota archaeon]|nr:FHA domain-containing protein [Candidatus Woesearchaeota archaeon]
MGWKDHVPSWLGGSSVKNYTKVKVFANQNGQVLKSWEFELRQNIGRDGDIVGLISLGRSSDNSLVVQGDGISRRHADILVVQNSNNTITLNWKDQSSNGSVIDGNQVKKGQTYGLCPKNEIIIGVNKTFIIFNFSYKLE